jgi:hypothetical protein
MPVYHLVDERGIGGYEVGQLIQLSWVRFR